MYWYKHKFKIMSIITEDVLMRIARKIRVSYYKIKKSIKNFIF